MTTPNAPLSPLAAAIAKSRTCRTQLTAEQIQTGVAEIRQLDRHSERKANSGCAQAVIGVLGIFFGFVTAAVTEQPAFLLISLGAVVWILLSLARYFLSKKSDFENRRYELLAKVVELLSKDMSPDAQLDLALNLLPQNDKSKFTHKGKAGHWNVQHYHDSWLSLEGRLLDGTKFSLHLAEKHQARSRMKRSSRGKMKYKSKSKNSSEATLFLKVKAEKYPQLAALGEGVQAAVQLPYWAHPKSVEVNGETLMLRVTTPTAWKVDGPPAPADEKAAPKKKPQQQGSHADGVELVMSMFLSLYQVLNLSRAIQKSSSPGGPAQ